LGKHAITPKAQTENIAWDYIAVNSDSDCNECTVDVPKKSIAPLTHKSVEKAVATKPPGLHFLQLAD